MKIETLHLVLAMKPLEGTFAQNALEHGVVGLNIDGCRVESGERPLRIGDYKPEAAGNVYAGRREYGHGFDGGSKAVGVTTKGRFPANVILDKSNEVIESFPLSSVTGDRTNDSKQRHSAASPLPLSGKTNAKLTEYTDSGSASRFFWSFDED